MKSATFYYDVISPFSYLFLKEIERSPLPLALTMQPVLFAALLKANDNKGPAEIEAKRSFTYRYCVWYAAQRGFAFALPGVHPFNPVRYLRLALLLEGAPSATQALFDALWTTGDDPQADSTWRRVCAHVGIDPADPRLEEAALKQRLRDATDRAIAAGVFGVPTVMIDGLAFWGVDALPMLREYLCAAPVFSAPEMRRADRLPVGARRS